MNKFYVTTPIYYVNSYPHLGHVYTTIIADTVARYKRQRGYEVFFLTGTDEHGINIERAAEAAGVPVKQHVDRIVDSFKTAFAPFQFTNRHWVRTTDDYHKEGVRKFWQQAKDNGWIYKGKYEGWYCGNCNEFYQEGEVEKGSDGKPVCPTHERPLDLLSEESYFFKLSAFQDKLIAHYEANPHFIRPETRRNEVLSFVRGGLNDLSVSRVSVKWGIPVPDDPEHTMYVWFDALSNYITAIGYGNQQFGGEEHYNKFWPADLQLVGKDILRFHTVYWPAFLMAAGLPLPKTVYSHGMWLSGGRKMSKTLGNVIDLAVLQKHFTTDSVRYFVLREMVFGHDGDFTYEALIDRITADLSNGLGNLSSRVLTMVAKYFGGIVPELELGSGTKTDLLQQSRGTFDGVNMYCVSFNHHFENYNFSKALEDVWKGVAQTDKFISDVKPWELAKSEETHKDLKLVLHFATEAVRYLTLQLAPILPDATQAIWEQLGQQGKVIEIDPGTFELHKNPNRKIGDIQPIFPRLDKKKIMEEIKQEEAASQAARAQETKPEVPAEPKQAEASAAAPAITAAPAEPVPGIAYIGIEDFLKVELRVAEIKTAERVPKADKLLRFTMDVGEAEPRQILAGIAQYYEPEKLIGRKVIIVANLAPRKLRGFESQGMVLAASIGDEGRPILAGFLEEVPNGARLK